MKRLSLIISIFLIFIMHIVVFIIDIKLNGSFTYALDDAYIHLAMAKNLYYKHILSVDGIHYASASSSILWMLILTPFMSLGIYKALYVPFILNMIFQILTIIAIYYYFEKLFHFTPSLLSMILLILIAPFIALSLGGMEHSMQILFTIVVVFEYLVYLRDNGKSSFIKLLIYSMLLGATRYEGLAIVLAISLFHTIYKRDIIRPILIFSFGLIPVIVFGIISLNVGLGFFPNSVMAKSVFGGNVDLMSLITHPIRYVLSNDMRIKIMIIFILIVNSYIFIMSHIKKKAELLALSFIFLFTFILHLTFGKFELGWLYRYEAYLIVFSYLNILLYLHLVHNFSFSLNIIGIVIIIILTIIFPSRIIKSPINAILDTKKIYNQQIQIARFLWENFNNTRVAVNDIGTIAYFTNVSILDLAGLGTYEVVILKKKGKFDQENVEELLKKYNVEIIVVYDWGFGLQYIDFERAGYKRVGRYKRDIKGRPISFYTTYNLHNECRQKFIEFSKTLPKDVIVKLGG